MTETTFLEFVEKKQRNAVRHLKLIKKMFEQGGLKVVDKLDEREDPHIYVVSPSRNLSFQGVRVYEIGNTIAYRVQKREDTHPFGRAYQIDVEGMFADLMSEEKMKDSEVGKEIIKSVVDEVKKFFRDSFEAEQKGPTLTDDPLGKAFVRASATGTDYADKVLGS